MIKHILIAFLSILSFTVFGQITGKIYGYNNGEKEKIEGAQVFFKKTRLGTRTNEEGVFKFDKTPKLPDTLIFRASGFYADTIVLAKKERKLNLEITLYSVQMLEEVVIRFKSENSSISKLNPIMVERLNSGELRKAACCNLSESFETNAAVDVNITDAVSGAKKIQMMGLDGSYTQIQFENIPILKNLGSAHGLAMIPGTWVNSIQITKGTGNVINGYESMAGLINLEFQNPDLTDKFYFNAYQNVQGRTEANFHTGLKVNNKWSTAILGHASLGKLELDRNKDGFRDVPLTENLTVMNRWNYRSNNFESKFGVRGSLTEKIGGEIDFNPRNKDGKYGVHIQNKHLEAFAKTGFLFDKYLNSSIGIIYQAKYHEINARFGNRSIKGVEKRGYINGIFTGILGNTDHTIKAGASLVYDNLEQEHFNIGMMGDTSNLNRTEIVPGVFTEYTYIGTRNSLILGARGDYHNLFGFQFSPRAHWKYKINEKLDLRATAGKGFRVPNYVVDNLSLLANNKAWTITEKLTPEISWNFGGSLVYNIELFKRKATWSGDFYHTLFTNQMIIDRDQNPSLIVIHNLKGRSFSNAFQTDFSFKPWKRVEMKFAYKYLDVRAEFGGELRQKIMIPKHRVFFNVGYTSRNKRWEYDFTSSVFGKKRLPVLAQANGELTTKNESDILPILSAQITHTYKRFEFYLGGENLLDFRQKNPIIDAANPFSTTFDATRTWAPVAGINIYAGLRFTIKKKDKKQ